MLFRKPIYIFLQTMKILNSKFFVFIYISPPLPYISYNAENQCACDGNSTEIFEYDNILKRPICERKKEAIQEDSKCQIRFVNATKFSSIRKSVRIYRLLPNEKCVCDPKDSENYRGSYCIKNELLKDIKIHQQYRNLPLTQTLNLSYELKYIVFFCKILHRRDYCNYLANLCVLTHYDLDKNGPCYSFYQQQNQQIGGIDEGGSIYGSGTNGANEFDGGEKMKPFLFFRNRKANKNLLDKFIDFSYNINSVSSICVFLCLFRGLFQSKNYNFKSSYELFKSKFLSKNEFFNSHKFSSIQNKTFFNWLLLKVNTIQLFYYLKILQANSTINFTISNFNLRGNSNELRPMRLSDIDLCNQYTTYAENIKFAKNFFSKCTINLREFIALKPDMSFSTLYLNYYENQANFLQIVPILMRNAYKVNEVSY